MPEYRHSHGVPFDPCLQSRFGAGWLKPGPDGGTGGRGEDAPSGGLKGPRSVRRARSTGPGGRGRTPKVRALTQLMPLSPKQRRGDGGTQARAGSPPAPGSGPSTFGKKPTSTGRSPTATASSRLGADTRPYAKARRGRTRGPSPCFVASGASRSRFFPYGRPESPPGAGPGSGLAGTRTPERRKDGAGVPAPSSVCLRGAIGPHSPRSPLSPSIPLTGPPSTGPGRPRA